MNDHLQASIEQFRSSSRRYAKSERYYRGDHDLAFATEKFANAFGDLFREFAMNLCPAVCDAVRDKLRIKGFVSDNTQGVQAQNIEEIWRRNRMPLRSAEIHKEVLRNGDGYAIVWQNAEGEAEIFPNKAATCTVFYDDEKPGKVNFAAKYWQTTEGRFRLNLFYSDRIERFISDKASSVYLPDATEFQPFIDGSGSNVSGNPYGVVPVFHFANNADIGTFGRSELEAAIPVQDGLNKAALDMLVAMEFSAFRQRWAAGIEIDYDTDGVPISPFNEAVDHLWIAENSNAKFGDFQTVDLSNFLKVKDSFRVDMASVTGTPLYYLLPHTRGFPSGESLRKSESRFIAKVRDRQAALGDTWAAVMEFALKIEGRSNVKLSVNWDDPSQVTEREMLENILMKKQIGISTEQALREAGYKS